MITGGLSIKVSSLDRPLKGGCSDWKTLFHKGSSSGKAMNCVDVQLVCLPRVLYQTSFSLFQSDWAPPSLSRKSLHETRMESFISASRLVNSAESKQQTKLISQPNDIPRALWHLFHFYQFLAWIESSVQAFLYHPLQVTCGPLPHPRPPRHLHHHSAVLHSFPIDERRSPTCEIHGCWAKLRLVEIWCCCDYWPAWWLRWGWNCWQPSCLLPGPKTCQILQCHSPPVPTEISIIF